MNAGVRSLLMDLSKYIFETIHESAEFMVKPGRRFGDTRSILVREPIADRPSWTTIGRLENE
jgi:hypothetical protein